MYLNNKKLIIEDVLDHVIYSKNQIEKYANQEYGEYKKNRSTDENDEDSEEYKNINKLMNLYEELNDDFETMEYRIRNNMKKFRYGELEFFKEQERWSLNIWPYDEVCQGRKTFSCGRTLQVEENGYWETYSFYGDSNGKYFIANSAKEKKTLCEGMRVRIKE